uniref:Titin n=1 Tax=Poecilia mexicana TaxID=48701 RepID=A0A3B3WVY4_9TELE
MLLIPESSRIDAGKYEITLENSAGKKSADIHVRVLDSPGPPLNLKPVKIDKESITLQWDSPLIDGGAKITNYIIEKRESTRKAFATAITKCPTTSVRIGDLGEGCEYYFRVSAENEFGIGEAVETTDPIRASQAPTPPESIIPTDITKNSVSLAWTKPKHDGGSRISGYVLEAKKKGTDQWAHVTTVKTLDFTVKNLNENEEYIFHVMAVNQSGRSAPRESKPIIVKDSTSLPEFDLRGVCQKTVIAKAGDDIKVEIPVMGRPRPTISWQKDGAALKLTQRVNVETTAATVIISISECTRADSGVYTMTAKNIVGSVTENIIIKVHDIPGPPKGPVKIVEISRTYCIFSWDAPENDGGIPINNYVTAQVEITSSYTSLVIDKMSRNDSGKYTVTAQNSSGTKSAFVVVRVLDTPSAPVALKVKEITNQSVTLAWEPPLLDGGSKIKNYIIEKRESTRKTYAAVVTNCHFTVSGLTENAQYDFRVIAKNSVGTVSKPSYNSGPITASDKVESPKYSIDPAFTKTVIINAGETFRLDADVHGKPLPSVQWFKDEKPVENTIRLEIKNTENHAMIIVKDCVRVDGGIYTLLLTNEAGSETVPFKVLVMDRPSPCEGPLHVTGVAEDRCTLAWRAPLHDGGSPITHYIIERRETSRLAWTVVSSTCNTTCYKVTKLLEGNEYMFRVMAVNSHGVSEALESAAVTMKNPFVPPGSPHIEDIFNITHEGMTITWSKPEHDGGSRIGGYLIEMQPKGTDKWGVAGNPKTCEGTVTGLTAGTEYLFRIIAYNEKGKSEPKALAAPVIANDMTIEPSIKMQFNTYNVLAGKDLKLEFPVLGSCLFH